jgi:hypothetical protein
VLTRRDPIHRRHRDHRLIHRSIDRPSSGKSSSSLQPARIHVHLRVLYYYSPHRAPLEAPIPPAARLDPTRSLLSIILTRTSIANALP